ncbi:hypothetical protein [Microbacterium sp. NPDC076911]|uniref:hypothetical protein n=1 Tax=Microbacterium sp. NPDC076911 TaxID=3154958 RepID=UPI0034316AC9
MIELPGVDERTWSYSWDRRPDPRLVELVSRDAALGCLSEITTAGTGPINIEFWADHDAHVQQIVAAVGPKRVFAFTWQGHRLRVDPGRLVAAHDSNVEWGRWHDMSSVADLAQKVVSFATDVTPRLVSGSSVASVGIGQSDELSYLAGRFVGTFRGASRREAVNEISLDIRKALERAQIPGYIPDFSPVADALYVNHDGGLVLAGTHSARAAEAAYAPAQILLCLRLLRLWMSTDTQAPVVLADVMSARRAANLAGSRAVSVSTAPKTSALVAVEAGMSERLRARLRAVWAAIVAADIPEARDLSVIEVDRAGALQALTL